MHLLLLLLLSHKLSSHLNPPVICSHLLPVEQHPQRFPTIKLHLCLQKVVFSLKCGQLEQLKSRLHHLVFVNFLNSRK